MSDELDLGSQRYQLLVHQLADDFGHRRGYKKRIADELGIHPSYVTRVEQGGQAIGDRTIEAACSRLSLDPAFFTLRDPDEPPHYKAFIREPPVSDYLHWDTGASPRETFGDSRETAGRIEMRLVHAVYQFAEDAGNELEEETWHEAREAASAIMSLPVIREAFEIATTRAPTEDLLNRLYRFPRNAKAFARALAIGMRVSRVYIDMDEEDRVALFDPSATRKKPRS